MTTSAPRPPVSSRTWSPAGRRCRVDELGGAELGAELAAVLQRLDQHRPPAEGGRGGDGAEPDRPATEHGHVVAGLDPAEAADGVEGAAERLDGGALLPGQLVGQAVRPVGADLEALGGRAADREAEVVGAAVDRALADDAVAGAHVAHLRADGDDLAGPLVTWDDRELDGDDVAVGEEVEVGVADAHLAGGDEHLVASDRRLVELGDLGALWSGKHECLHDSPLLVVREHNYNRLHSSIKGATCMKAARYHGRLDIRIEDVPTPVPADDELLLSVAAVGICGTDAAEFAHGPTMFPIESAHAVTGHRGPMTPGSRVRRHGRRRRARRQRVRRG